MKDLIYFDNSGSTSRSIACSETRSDPEYSTDLLNLSVLRLDSPCQYGFSGDGNSHKRPSLTSINSQQPKPKKLCLDDSTAITTAYPLHRRCVPYSFHLPLPVQFSPQSARLRPRPQVFR
ncbi:hypothetical protein L484_001929 [Morus notabilis]|uniref:Uncharacterized protein n=1 Tax=Morus notabilis TaxID=981085 RepID=W9RQ60_9ROSA|nr:hypothetical protein L484_001929 [Morus notabilis]